MQNNCTVFCYYVNGKLSYFYSNATGDIKRQKLLKRTRAQRRENNPWKKKEKERKKLRRKVKAERKKDNSKSAKRKRAKYKV